MSAFLMLSTFDLYLLLYVIRLVGWLKHCNLSSRCCQLSIARHTNVQRCHDKQHSICLILQEAAESLSKVNKPAAFRAC